MVTDQGRDTCLFFGGTYQDPGPWLLLGDTWDWTGTGWTQLAPTTSPTPRKNHAMGYDAQRGVTVLFGGETSLGSDGETWEFR